jgi:sec-independent protein translocase protein TatC
MPLDQDFNEVVESPKEMSFFEHLDELRKYIIRALAGVGVFMVLALANKKILFWHIIFAPTRLDFWTYKMLCKLSYRFNGTDDFCIKSIDYEQFNPKVTGQLTQYFMISAVAGVVLAFPWILYQLWLFIKPALSKQEIRYSRGMIFYCSFLFFLGVLFGYFILTPVSLNFLGSFKLIDTLDNKFTTESIIGFISMLTLASGIIFELPIIIYFLTRIGIVSVDFLKKYRRYAIVIILLLSAIITPPDVVSQILMTIPLAILYEAGIVIARRVEKRKAREAV